LTVFDNRAGDALRTVEVPVRAARPTATDTAQTTLQGFTRDLHKIFVFEPFPIRLERCRVAGVFARPTGILLCAEYAGRLDEMLGDKAPAADLAPARVLRVGRKRSPRRS
jgi:hypothetical protein